MGVVYPTFDADFKSAESLKWVELGGVGLRWGGVGDPTFDADFKSV